VSSIYAHRKDGLFSTAQGAFKAAAVPIGSFNKEILMHIKASD